MRNVRPTQDAPVAIELSRKIRVDDTLEMGYYLDDCTDPWTTPDTLVLLPGCRKPRQMYYAWIPTLARHFRVIRPHFRGHWDSTPAPQGYQWTSEGVVSDLKNFIAALGLDKVHLIAEGMAGVFAYQLAHRHPECIRTMILLTTPGPNFKHHPLGKKGSMDVHHPVWGSDEAWTARLLQEFGTQNRALAEWHNTERWKCPEDATKGYFKAAASCEVNEAKFLAGIPVPTLMMMGAEHRRLITPQETQRLCDLMPNARLLTFPGVSAVCQYVIPEKCAQEAVNFINAQ